MNDEDVDFRLHEYAGRWGGDLRVEQTPSLERRRRHTGRHLALGTAAAVVLVVVGGGYTLRAARTPPAGPAATSLGPTQAVSFHGIAVLAPAAWPVNGLACGTPVRDTVIVAPGVQPLCLIQPEPKVSTVELRGSAKAPVSGHSGRSTSLDGVAAWRGERFHEGRWQVTLTVPSHDAIVLAQSPSRDLARLLVASARIVAVDANGCDGRLRAPLVAPRPTRPGTAAVMVPSGALSVTSCTYVDGWLERSMSLAPARANRFLAAMNRGQRGTSRWNPKTWGGQDCSHEFATGIRYRVSYRSGPPVTLVGRLLGCTRLGVSNGALSVQLTDSIEMALMDTSANSEGPPMPLRES